MQHTLFWAIVTIVVFFAVAQGTVAYMILLERKIAAWVQDRIGPNRVGPGGLLQPIADGLKFLLKEELIPAHVDKVLFLLAPSLALITALMAVAVVPFGPTNIDPTSDNYQFVIAPSVDIGVLYVFAIGSLAAYAIVLAGYASNDKYSFLGAMRASAQLISYEIPLGMAIVGIVLFAGSLNLERIIAQQVTGGWNILYQPLAFMLFLTASFAECNRLPFDLSEAEQELVGGFHTEYSGMKFALFFLGEYTHMITTSLLMTTLFFGGWHFPWIAPANGFVLAKLAVFLFKLFLFIVLFMLVRWTIPRFRFDQLMGLAWKVMIPLSLINLLFVAFVREFDITPWVLLPISLLLIVGAGLFATRGSNAPQRGMGMKRLGMPTESLLR